MWVVSTEIGDEGNTSGNVNVKSAHVESVNTDITMPVKLKGLET